ncbi:MAG: hypothetical protein JXB47_07490 [Anaerolineae bacterium]|nr:hypothetical protein [Anaerolineae bacterium]
MRWNPPRLLVINGALAVTLAALLLLIRLTAPGGIAPPAPQPGELLYATTFDDFNDEWDLYEGRRAAQVEDGMLKVSIDVANNGSFSWLDRIFGDFDLTVEAMQLAGPDDNGFGVIFRHRDPDNHYHLLISGDGYYKVTRVKDGEAETLTADWRASAHIKPGTGETNVIRVVGRGSRFTFYINGARVDDLCLGENVVAFNCAGGELSDALVDETFPYGRVGVGALSFGTPGVVVGFDNMVVVGPEPQ